MIFVNSFPVLVTILAIATISSVASSCPPFKVPCKICERQIPGSSPGNGIQESKNLEEVWILMVLSLSHGDPPMAGPRLLHSTQRGTSTLVKPPDLVTTVVQHDFTITHASNAPANPSDCLEP
ncbi:hypothetical protein H4Q26_014804 [Puccinia striiformis f. sp. tritici PST-130]|nr:hypothetical protein H4Q26_014804 [Puccinia striiformis f. sp. tritici PST-130]